MGADTFTVVMILLTGGISAMILVWAILDIWRREGSISFMSLLQRRKVQRGQKSSSAKTTDSPVLADFWAAMPMATAHQPSKRVTSGR
jgi:hypothetical protein